MRAEGELRDRFIQTRSAPSPDVAVNGHLKSIFIITEGCIIGDDDDDDRNTDL